MPQDTLKLVWDAFSVGAPNNYFYTQGNHDTLGL